ncbi:hypothetical protein DFH09DRAFT_1359788 [Mycena vulgaris]|nr:hypothetical protein DFH09DRAFT_1359788 [Mycena vulgaris]
MSDPHGSLQGPPLARRRTSIACSKCRKRKIKCTPSGDGPHDPCARCLRRGLQCKYVAVSERVDQAAPGPSTPRAGTHATLPPPSGPLHDPRGRSSWDPWDAFHWNHTSEFGDTEPPNYVLPYARNPQPSVPQPPPSFPPSGPFGYSQRLGVASPSSASPGFFANVNVAPSQYHSNMAHCPPSAYEWTDISCARCPPGACYCGGL